MADTSIEWTEKTWNPVRGCSVLSAGCTNCYAMRTAHRFSGPGGHYEGLTRARTKLGPVWTGDVRFVPEKLAEPLGWREPKRVFVNSMSDLFHDGVTDEQIAAVFGVMAAAPQHTFQVLTKRPERARDWLRWVEGLYRRNASPWVTSLLDKHARSLVPTLPAEPRHGTRWPLTNVWLGVSVEDQATADERIPLLLECPAAVRWVSYEPALGPIDFERIAHRPAGDTDDPTPLVINALRGFFDGSIGAQRALDWIVIGGESGPGARPFDLAWARSTIRAGRAAGVPVFVKQLGACPVVEPRDAAGYRITGPGGDPWPSIPVALRDRKGGDPSEWPEDLRVREYPPAMRGRR
jgi:protein gp37